MLKLSSGMGLSGDDFGLRSKAVEEAGDSLPNFGAAREPFPVGGNVTDQTIPLIDRRNLGLGARSGSRISDAIDQKRLNVGLKVIQHRVLLDYLLPGIERQKRFDSTRGAGIESCDSAGNARLK